jgi:hypothetical protein
VRGDAEHLKVPLPESRRGIECRFEHAGIARIGARHFDGEGFRATHFGTADPPAAGFSQLDRADRHGAPHQVLERPAHQREVVASIHRAREAGQEIRERLPPLALSAPRAGAWRRSNQTQCHRGRGLVRSKLA